jgi:hypothetical protein
MRPIQILQQQFASAGRGSGTLSDDAGMSAVAGESAADLAKTLQNPISEIISVPSQSNTNFNVGANKSTQNILNIQPVISFHLNANWNLITPTIVPLVWIPSFQPGQSVPPFSLSPASFTAFLSPNAPVDGWVWGVVRWPRCRRHRQDSRLQCLGARAGRGRRQAGRSDRRRGAGQQCVFAWRHFGTWGHRNTAASRSIRSAFTTWAKGGLSAACRSSLPLGRLLATRPERCLWVCRVAA